MNIVLVSEISQVVISVLLIFLVMIQYKGKGLTSSIGSSFAFYGSRRGVEKLIFGITILLSVLLVINSVALLMFPR